MLDDDQDCKPALGLTHEPQQPRCGPASSASSPAGEASASAAPATASLQELEDRKPKAAGAGAPSTPASSTASGDAATTGPGSSVGKKRHVCPTCDKSFSTSGHLSRHQRTHTGERAHACPWPGCTTRCSRQDNLQQHYRTHLSPRSRRASLSSAKAMAAGIRSISDTVLDDGTIDFSLTTVTKRRASSTAGRSPTNSEVGSRRSSTSVVPPSVASPLLADPGLGPSPALGLTTTASWMPPAPAPYRPVPAATTAAGSPFAFAPPAPPNPSASPFYGPLPSLVPPPTPDVASYAASLPGLARPPPPAAASAYSVPPVPTSFPAYMAPSPSASHFSPSSPAPSSYDGASVSSLPSPRFTHDVAPHERSAGRLSAPHVYPGGMAAAAASYGYGAPPSAHSSFVSATTTANSHLSRSPAVSEPSSPVFANGGPGDDGLSHPGTPVAPYETYSAYATSAEPSPYARPLSAPTAMDHTADPTASYVPHPPPHAHAPSEIHSHSGWSGFY